MTTFQVAIIGCGRPWKSEGATGFGMGHAHASGYKASPDCEIVAAADINQENLDAFCQQHDVPNGYLDVDEMFAQEKLDIVSICLWPHLHAPMTFKAAEAGVKAVHCEKPMAPTFGEARKMVDVCAANDVQLTFNHQRRFGKPFRKAKELLDSGAIGRLERVEAFTDNLYDWGTHWFDMMFFYNDEIPVEWVIGQIDARGGRPIFGAMIEGQGLSLFKWKNGVSGIMITGHREPLRSIDCNNRLIGSEGTVEVGVHDGPSLRLRNIETGHEWREIDVGGGIHDHDLHTKAVLDLVDALKTGREPELSGRKALQATELIFGTYESSRRRGRVDLPLDIDDSPYVAMLNRADITTWPAADVVANGIKIHYHRSGGDKPPLVLAHGFTDNGLCWTPVARALERDYDVIMYDARGHGFSDLPEAGYTDKDQAADLVGLIRALGLEKPAVMGHSMGAATAALAAAMYPDTIGRVILEDPPWSTEVEPEERAAMLEEWRAGATERKRMSREALMAQGRDENPTWDEAEIGPWAESKRQLNLIVFSGIGGRWTPWQETAAQISCPTLMITADPDLGAIVTPEVAEQVTKMNANIQVVHVNGAGHNIRREGFEPFMQAVTEFLAHA